MSITGIDYDKLAALFHDELHRTFSVRFQWYTCSDLFQQIWEHSIKQAVARMASEEADENGVASLLLERLSTPPHPLDADFYSLAAVIYYEIRKRYESGVPFFGLANPWERRTQKTHDLWAFAIRQALSRTGLSDENPGGDGYMIHVDRVSADQLYVPPPRFVPAKSDQPAPPQASSGGESSPG